MQPITRFLSRWSGWRYVIKVKEDFMKKIVSIILVFLGLRPQFTTEFLQFVASQSLGSFLKAKDGELSKEKEKELIAKYLNEYHISPYKGDKNFSVVVRFLTS